MIIQFGIHDPQWAAVRRFQNGGRQCASINFDQDDSFTVYTSPEMAERIKFAVNGPAVADYEMTTEIEPAEGLLDYVNCGFAIDRERIDYDPSVGDMTSSTAVTCTLLWAHIGGLKLPRYMLCDMIGEARVIALESHAAERATEYENAA